MMAPRIHRLLRMSHPAGSIEVTSDGLVIRLPDPRLLRLAARSLLVVAALTFFPLLRLIAGTAAAFPCIAPTSRRAAPSDEIFTNLQLLLADMRRHGLAAPSSGRAAFVGDPPPALLPLLRRSRVDPVRGRQMAAVIPRSLDLVILLAGGGADTDLAFADRVLKVGGVAVVRLGAEQFRLLPNYRIVYIRRFGSTFVAVKKTAHWSIHDPADLAGVDEIRRRRRLLSVSISKKKLMMKKMRKKKYYSSDKNYDDYDDMLLLIVEYPWRRRINFIANPLFEMLRQRLAKKSEGDWNSNVVEFLKEQAPI